MAVFMKYGSLKGEATAEGTSVKYNSGWIQCNSFELGAGRGVSVGPGGGSLRESTAPSISEIRVSKQMDSVDALLWKEALGGAAETVTIHLTQTDKNGKHIAFQEYTLKDTLISGYSIGGGEGQPSIALSLNFGEIVSEYFAIDSKFNRTTTGKVGYDLVKAKML
jgi:type VI secretion system secreted protein Hcp